MVRQLLSINTSPSRLEINSSRAQLNITAPKVSAEYNVTKSKLDVKQDRIKVNIDRRDMYASMGVYMPDMFRQKTESEAKQVVLETIAQIVDDWQSIGETQGATLLDICLRNSGWNPVELYQTYTPSSKPNITWSGGTPTKIDFSRFNLDIKWNMPENPKPNMEYRSGKVNISVSQYNKVNIEYNGTLADVMTLGMDATQKLNIKI